MAWTQDAEGNWIPPNYQRPGIPRAVRRAVIARDGYRCYWCGTTDAETVWELDHVIPWADGGVHSVENLVHSCHPCNRRRATEIARKRRAERTQ